MIKFCLNSRFIDQSIINWHYWCCAIDASNISQITLDVRLIDQMIVEAIAYFVEVIQTEQVAQVVGRHPFGCFAIRHASRLHTQFIFDGATRAMVSTTGGTVPHLADGRTSGCRCRQEKQYLWTEDGNVPRF